MAHIVTIFYAVRLTFVFRHKTGRDAAPDAGGNLYST